MQHFASEYDKSVLMTDSILCNLKFGEILQNNFSNDLAWLGYWF